MPNEHTTVEQASTGSGQAVAPAAPPEDYEDAGYAQLDEDEDWPQQPVELAPRPRRRLLSPAPLALLAVLLTACGFIGGVLVEKGQSSSNASSSGAAGLIASRLSALRGGSSGAAGLTGASGSGSASGGGSGAREAAGLGGAGARPVAGQVAYLSGSTLYVTNSEGNTLAVHTSPATSVTKSVKASVAGIHPGETVTVVGASAANGSVSAESIRVGSGGLSSLFASGGSSARTPSGGGPALFGPGG
jgi:hypothetical protein